MNGMQGGQRLCHVLFRYLPSWCSKVPEALVAQACHSRFQCFIYTVITEHPWIVEGQEQPAPMPLEEYQPLPVPHMESTIINQNAWHGGLSTSPISTGSVRGPNERGSGHNCGTGEDLKKLCKEGRLKEALHILDVIDQQGIHSNLSYIYACLLQGCIVSKALAEGKQIHAHVIKKGFNLYIFLKNSLLHMYVRCAQMDDARQIFDSMSYRDAFTWTLMIGGYTKSGHTKQAFELFFRMEPEGVKPNEVTSVSILKACTTLGSLKEIHAFIIKVGIKLNAYVGNTLVNIYSKCGSIEDALQVFAQMPLRDVISWNSIIAGHTENGLAEKAFELFKGMKSEGARPDDVTFLSILNACASMGAWVWGKQIHLEVNHGGFDSDVFVASALVDMYAKCDSVEDARVVFDKMTSRDVVCWNAVISGYAQHGDANESFKLFAEMEQDGLKPDKVTFLSILNACANIGCLDKSKDIHARIIACELGTGAFVGSTLVDMYAKCGSVEDARRVFDRMQWQDLVSWNAIIAGYSNHGPTEEAFTLFQMMEWKGMKPDKVTFLTILKACGSLAALEQGKHIHSCIIQNGLDSDVFVGSSLIDMYAKCGSMYLAYQVFNTMHERDAVSWSAMVAGYAQNGQAEEALKLFLLMRQERVKMDHITFVGVLTACTHAGLVDEGREYFNSMMKDHGITPTAELCACVVDLFGRAGRLREAVGFIEQTVAQPSASVWMALLSACKVSGNIQLAEHAAERVLELDPHSTAAFVLLSNVYAAAGRLGTL